MNHPIMLMAASLSTLIFVTGCDSTTGDVPALAARLKTAKESRTLVETMAALRVLGPKARTAIPDIITAVGDNWSPDVRTSAVTTLKAIGWIPNDAPYVFKVTSPTGQEVTKLCRYCLAYRFGQTGLMMLDAEDGSVFAPPRLPEGGKATLLNQSKGTVEFALP